MTITTTCDHCGQPVGKDDRLVKVTVSERLGSWSKNMTIEQRPPIMDLTLDMHQQCYAKVLLPHITASVGAPA